MVSELESGKLPSRIDIATVVYEPEIALLKLQARSIRKFFRPKDIGTIFVVVNEMAPEATYSAIKTDVLEEYGDLLKQVEIIPASHLMRPHVNVGGWRTQQSLKLLISNYVSTEHYLLLDAKNHFVRPTSISKLIDPGTGKIRTFRVAKHGSLEAYLNNALEYFGIEPRETSLPATTPYVMLTSAVQGLIQYIADREGATLDDFMHRPGQNLTEFFLYYAFLESQLGGAESFYRYGPRNTVAMFTRYPNNQEQVDRLMSTLEEGKILCFGLHKNRVGILDEATVARICSFWTAQGLFEDDAEAMNYYADLSSKVQRRTVISESGL